MNVYDMLAASKGTVSSACGKELAARVLAGEGEILDEVVAYSVYELENVGQKHVRASAAKAVEIVAEARPKMVAPYLESLLPALVAPEPQTRWMILRTFGFCAAAVPKVAEKAIPFAALEIEKKEGLIVASSADLFLGDIGAVSKTYMKAVFPFLQKSANSLAKNEVDWVLEAFLVCHANLTKSQNDFVKAFAQSHLNAERKSTKNRAKRLLKQIAGDCLSTSRNQSAVSNL